MIYAFVLVVLLVVAQEELIGQDKHFELDFEAGLDEKLLLDVNPLGVGDADVHVDEIEKLEFCSWGGSLERVAQSYSNSAIEQSTSCLCR